MNWLVFFALLLPLTPAHGAGAILGRPTDRSVTVSVMDDRTGEVRIEYGTEPGVYNLSTGTIRLEAGKPAEILLDRLRPNTRYYYRQRTPAPGVENSFHTQRAPGSTFTFGVQGDSHPERRDRMYDADLYVRTLDLVRRTQPDFYVMLGDDFSIDPLYNRGTANAASVNAVYAAQRRFLERMAAGSALFLVNGNHEQAARYLLNGKPDSPPVLAGIARNLFFPNPAPDSFYTGNAEKVEFVGLPRDYYAWTWGDALFVTIDPYWHSPVQIDAGLGGGQGQRRGEGAGKGQGQRKGEGKGGGGRNRDGWVTTMGDAQYNWLAKTLATSNARYKFIFTHQVLGTGRGGVELADLFEWGGRNRAGEQEFTKYRPGWELPVHQLLVKHGVTIVFHGHDHLFARQEKEGVVYQETPNPADPTYTAFNREAYRSGDVLPNSGYLRVTVSPAETKVDYIRSCLPRDEKPGQKHGEVAFSYRVTPVRKK
jgi:hypothetical protein